MDFFHCFQLQAGNKRVKFIRDLVREVVGFAPYEKRCMELLRISKDKRALKFVKKRVRDLYVLTCTNHVFLSWNNNSEWTSPNNLIWFVALAWNSHPWKEEAWRNAGSHRCNEKTSPTLITLLIKIPFSGCCCLILFCSVQVMFTFILGLLTLFTKCAKDFTRAQWRKWRPQTCLQPLLLYFYNINLFVINNCKLNTVHFYMYLNVVHTPWGKYPFFQILRKDPCVHWVKSIQKVLYMYGVSRKSRNVVVMPVALEES